MKKHQTTTYLGMGITYYIGNIKEILPIFKSIYRAWKYDKANIMLGDIIDTEDEEILNSSALFAVSVRDDGYVDAGEYTVHIDEGISYNRLE